MGNNWIYSATVRALRKLAKALKEEIEIEIGKEESNILAPLSVILNTIK